MSEQDQHALPLESRLAALGQDGRVTADEVLFLRRTVFADGVVSDHELDALFALGERAPAGDPEWPQFFAEAASDFYLREEEPEGYLTREEFASLKTRVMRKGGANALERQLLIKLMESARSVPTEMSAFVGAALKAGVMAKDGGPAIDKGDVALLRRWLFAAGGDGHVGVTRAEAEVLCDINDAVRGGEADPAWGELFSLAIVNHLMAGLGYSAASREEAMRRHAFISDHSVEVGGFFRRMAAGVFDAFRGAKQKSVYEQRAEDRDAAVAAAEKVMPEEASWLAIRIGRDGAFDDNERRVVERMKELGADLPEELKALVDRAA
ncbi:MAG: hypothetical protein AAFW81_06730 [Pseudomonadota bacterium]